MYVYCVLMLESYADCNIVWVAWSLYEDVNLEYKHNFPPGSD
jgi:hypothetical protein